MSELAATQRGFARDVKAGDVRVYSHAWFARLLGALREDYAELAVQLGDDAFHDLAKLYFMVHPSRTFSLRFAGAQLAEFLAGPVAEFFQRRWPFAAELAALEWAKIEVFDAEDSPRLARAELAGVPVEAWAGLRFALVPAHRLLTDRLVYRRDEQVFVRALEPDEARALALLRDGAEFGAICAELGSAERALTLLERWLADALLASVSDG